MPGFFILAFVATVLSTLVGFGSGILLIAGSTMFFDVKWSIGLATHLFLFNTVFKTTGLWRSVEKKFAATILVTAIPAVWWGTQFLLETSGVWIERALAILILLDLITEPILKARRRSQSTKDGVERSGQLTGLQIATTGVLYGWLSGAVGSGSVVKAMVFRRAGWSHETFVATMAATALLLNVLKVVVFWEAGLIGPDEAPWIVGLLGVSWFGVKVGQRLLPRISTRVAAILVRLMLGAIAVRLLLS